jgi:hypothetical protein
MADAADLKSVVRLLTYCYQTILRSIYRRFSRQSKLTSCLVSLGDPRIFHASLGNEGALFRGKETSFDGFELVQFESKRHSCLKLAFAFGPLVAANDLQKCDKQSLVRSQIQESY